MVAIPRTAPACPRHQVQKPDGWAPNVPTQAKVPVPLLRVQKTTLCLQAARSRWDLAWDKRRRPPMAVSRLPATRHIQARPRWPHAQAMRALRHHSCRSVAWRPMNQARQWRAARAMAPTQATAGTSTRHRIWPMAPVKLRWPACWAAPILWPRTTTPPAVAARWMRARPVV